MRHYLGVKQVEAEPQTRGEYVASRGWKMPEDENPYDAGYRIVYPDGYISWSPLQQFVMEYRDFLGLTFGLAIEAMKKGSRVTRRGWNGRGMWLCLSPGGLVPASQFWAPNNRSFAEAQPTKDAWVKPYITMKTVDEQIVPWTASQSDMLAEDWEVVL